MQLARVELADLTAGQDGRGDKVTVTPLSTRVTFVSRILTQGVTVLLLSL